MAPVIHRRDCCHPRCTPSVLPPIAALGRRPDIQRGREHRERRLSGPTESSGRVPEGNRILIVDNGPPVGTGRIADWLARGHRGEVSVLHRPRPEGLGRAYIAGLERALKGGALGFSRWTPICPMLLRTYLGCWPASETEQDSPSARATSAAVPSEIGPRASRALARRLVVRADGARCRRPGSDGRLQVLPGRRPAGHRRSVGAIRRIFVPGRADLGDASIGMRHRGDADRVPRPHRRLIEDALAQRTRGGRPGAFFSRCRCS